MKRASYRKAGVDVAKAEGFIRGIQKIFPVKQPDRITAFGTPFLFDFWIKKYRRPVLVASADGVGTKLILARQFHAHRVVGKDLVAMNVNDIICLGARPLFFLDYIACGKLRPPVLLKIMQGIRDGLRDSQCRLLGGETAEMPGVYGVDEYDLAGFCVGVASRSKVIDGKRIKSGDVVIGLESSGLHSNGFSLVRNIFTSREIKRYARHLLIPTRIYVKPVLKLVTGRDFPFSALKGIAHVTGGAFYSKVTKVLPAGLGMVVEKKSWSVPEIFRIIQKKGSLDEKEMYSVFNMGIGMVVVVDKKYAGRALSILNRDCRTHRIGKIIKSDKKITFI